MDTPGKQAEFVQYPVETKMPHTKAKESVSIWLRARK